MEILVSSLRTTSCSLTLDAEATSSSPISLLSSLISLRPISSLFPIPPLLKTTKKLTSFVFHPNSEHSSESLQHFPLQTFLSSQLFSSLNLLNFFPHVWKFSQQRLVLKKLSISMQHIVTHVSCVKVTKHEEEENDHEKEMKTSKNCEKRTTRSNKNEWKENE